MNIIPSLALLNGKFWTVNHKQPWVEAVAIHDNIIVAAGSTSQVKKIIGSATCVIDLQRKFTMPGFNDAHLHFGDGALALQGVDLREAKGETEFVTKIKNYAATIPKGTWILRGNWNHENWRSQKHPCKELIDAAIPDHPVFVCRIDDHIALANSLALKLSGIDRETPNPPGGEIKKDPGTGEPTGILIDKAWNLVTRAIPSFTFDQTKATLTSGLAYAAKYGITSFQDNSSTIDLQVYQVLLQEGKLTARVNAWRPVELMDHFITLGVTANFGSDMLRIGALKIYADGSMGAGSALFYEPYLDDLSTCGLSLLSEEELNRAIVAGDAAGLQLTIHAIGDRANSLVLDALERAYKENGKRIRRHRIEHCQVVTPEDMVRYKSLGVVASIQPSHCIDDMAWAEKRIDRERCKNAYRVGSFIQHGIPIALGTDWAVESLNPMVGLYAAVTRESISGGPLGGWFPNEKITIEQAIEGYTLGSAYAEFAEQNKGSLENGKLADMVVLSKNLIDVSPREYLGTEVLCTIVDGKVVYQNF